MKKKKAIKNDKVYVFEVVLGLDSPKMQDGKINKGIVRNGKAPRREIAVLGNQNLYNLAEAINESFGFIFDHCFGFYDNFKNIYQSKEKYELFVDAGEEPTPGAKSVEKTKISQVFKEEEGKLLFFFDYGDDWEFIIKLKNIIPAEIDKPYPVLLNSFGEKPEQYPEYD